MEAELLRCMFLMLMRLQWGFALLVTATVMTSCEQQLNLIKIPTVPWSLGPRTSGLGSILCFTKLKQSHG